MSRTALLVSFILAILFLAVHEIVQLQRVPRPQAFMHAVWVWGVLGIVSELGLPEIAAVFSFGVVIAMAYTYFETKKPLLAPKDDGSTPPSGFGAGAGVGASGSGGGGGGGSF